MARDPRIDRLQGVYLFNRCSEKELKKVAGIIDEIDFAPGQVLCREGGLASECFIVVDGEAEVRVGEHVVSTVGAGQSIGEMGLIGQRPRSATVVATSPMSAYVIDGRRFRTLLDESPGVTRALLEELADRLRALDVTYSAPATA